MGTLSRQVEATIASDNAFTDPIAFYGGPFNFSVSGSFTATVTIQRRFTNPATGLYDGTWLDVSTYTSEREDVGIVPDEEVQYRAGVKTGEYTSGTINLRLSQ